MRLSGEERERLERLIRKGKSPARRVLKARILLKADLSEAGKGLGDNRIIEALETSPSMVYGRKQLVEVGLLENKVVELGIVDRASDSTIGRALKKTLFSPILQNMEAGSIWPSPSSAS